MDEFRIKLPADETIAKPLSNAARGNLRKQDLELLQKATDAAARNVGKEQAWRSLDGKSRGRVVAYQNGSECYRAYLEVEVSGAVEKAGPLLACRGDQGFTLK
jgi:surface antigen